MRIVRWLGFLRGSAGKKVKRSEKLLKKVVKTFSTVIFWRLVSVQKKVVKYFGRPPFSISKYATGDTTKNNAKFQPLVVTAHERIACPAAAHQSSRARGTTRAAADDGSRNVGSNEENPRCPQLGMYTANCGGSSNYF
jgi:hypothetical protein